MSARLRAAGVELRPEARDSRKQKIAQQHQRTSYFLTRAKRSRLKNVAQPSMA